MKITMENYSKLIDEVFKRLDWDHIMKYYDQNKEIEEEQPNKRGKRVRLNTKTVATVKKELRDLVRFVVDSNFSELQHDNWIILWSNKESGFRLEIVFTPTRAVVLEDEDTTDEEELPSSDEVERDVLRDMLKKSNQEENYELSAVIYSRLKKLDKSIGLKTSPHQKHKE
jgi:hypothetical protein